MKVFISWSGPRSKVIAEALRNWLPSVVQACNPWISCSDIDAGVRWGPKLAKELQQTNFGILCLTIENLTAPWLLFEAGALSKVVDESNVCPLLLDIQPSDITGPLAQFQAVKADKEGVLKLVKAINHAQVDRAINETHIVTAFKASWPQLYTSIRGIPKIAILENTRETDSHLVDGAIEKLIPTDQQMLSKLKHALHTDEERLVLLTFLHPNAKRNGTKLEMVSEEIKKIANMIAQENGLKQIKPRGIGGVLSGFTQPGELRKLKILCKERHVRGGSAYSINMKWVPCLLGLQRDRKWQCSWMKS